MVVSSIAADAAVHRDALAWINDRRAELGHPPLERLGVDPVGDPLVGSLPEELHPILVGDGASRRLGVLHDGEQLACDVPAAVLAVVDRPELVDVDPSAVAPPPSPRGYPSDRLGLGIGADATVVAIEADSPASRAGLAVGDRILRVAGIPVLRFEPDMVVTLLESPNAPRYSVTVESGTGSVSNRFVDVVPR